MDLSKAVSALERLDEERFCYAFQQLHNESFHVNDLQFWCELTGTSMKSTLESLIKQGYNRMESKIYVRGTIETMEELRKICNLYGLQKKDITNTVVHVLTSCKGYLPIVLKRLPLSYNVVRILLELQDLLISITPLYWLPKTSLPRPLRLISRNSHTKRSQWDELIFATFVRIGKPLRLEELIYQCMGYVTLPVPLKRIFTFMLTILPLERVQNTEFWILTEWGPRVDLALIERVTVLITEYSELPLEEVVKALPHYKESQIVDTLAFWPEFKQVSDNTYAINIVPLDDELISLIVPSILKNLEDTDDGILFSQLFKTTKVVANSYGLNLYTRDFKNFLKGWGEVAIVGDHVYAMERAPFHRLRLGDVAYLVLKKNGAPMSYSELKDEIRHRRDYKNSISSVLQTEPKLSRPSRGYWALREWGLIEYDPQIHNRIGGVLIAIIEKSGRPVHKSEIRRQLRRLGMDMNEGTLHMDLMENERIHQVARGVYALSEWNLSFRDLFRFKFPFRLTLPDGNPTIYDLENGTMIEYFISKYCLQLGRVLVKRYIDEYFPKLEQYSKYKVTDFVGVRYEGWVDRLDDGRYQFLGLQRWYKTHKPKYGENIYIYIPRDEEYTFSLLTADQADVMLSEGK